MRPWPGPATSGQVTAMADEPIILIMDPKLGRGRQGWFGLRAWLWRHCWLYAEPDSWLWPRQWAAGKLGHCAVWGYRTPWTALYGAWELHMAKRGGIRLSLAPLLLASAGLVFGALALFIAIALMASGWIVFDAIVGAVGMLEALLLHWLLLTRRARLTGRFPASPREGSHRTP